MICASCSTVTRISLKSASKLASCVGASLSASESSSQLKPASSGAAATGPPQAITHTTIRWFSLSRLPRSASILAASSRTRSLEMKKSCWLTYI